MRHFKDVEDCFLEAYDAATRAILAEVEATVLASGLRDWREQFEVAIAAYLGALASDHAVARACLVDVVGAGPRAVRPAATSTGSSSCRSARCDTAGRGKDTIPEVQFWAAVGAIGELVQDHIVEEERCAADGDARADRVGTARVAARAAAAAARGQLVEQSGREHRPAPTDGGTTRRAGSEQLSAVPALVHVLLDRAGLVPLSPFDRFGARGTDPSGFREGSCGLALLDLTDRPHVIAVVTPSAVNQEAQGTAPRAWRC